MDYVSSLPYFGTIDHTMLKYIVSILQHLRSCFSQIAAYHWFVVMFKSIGRDFYYPRFVPEFPYL
ncbi:hypothetical protein V6C20_03835 [Caldibacillus thermoamylovorans]